MSLAAAPVSLPDVSVSRADMASVRGRLRTYQARYASFFGRRELRGHARAYLRGLLSDEPRKSVERMVLRLRGADANAVRTQQLFLRKARWDDAPILAATLGEEEGVLAIDGTDIPKDGSESVGVARQYCGQLGKRANCQAAVYAAYLGRGAAALVDRRLYLNRDWVSGDSHAVRRQRTGVPAGTPFRSKPQLALEMLAGLVAEGTLPLRWVTCDEVPRNTHVWTTRPTRSGPPSQAVAAVADQLPRAAWRFILREGSKGPQAVLCAVRRVTARRGREPGPDVWLLLRRNPATDELKGYLCHGPADMAPERLVWLAGLRWPIEQCFRDGKQLFGLGDYEGRNWQGWHRHATLVMLAHFFVVRETCDSQKTVRPDRAPDLPAGGRGPAPHRFPGLPRHRGLPPGIQRGRRYCAYLFRQYEVSLHY